MTMNTASFLLFGGITSTRQICELNLCVKRTSSVYMDRQSTLIYQTYDGNEELLLCLPLNLLFSDIFVSVAVSVV